MHGSEVNPDCPSTPSHGPMGPYGSEKFRCIACCWTGDRADLDEIAARHALLQAEQKRSAGVLAFHEEAKRKMNPSQTTSSTSTTCARCHHAFTSRPDGFVDEALENEIAEHQERCFVVGEAVLVGRCDHDRTSEGKSGTVARIDDRALRQGARYLPFLVKLDKASATHGNCVWCEDLRRIPRPGQEVDRVRALPTSPGVYAVQLPADRLAHPGWQRFSFERAPDKGDVFVLTPPSIVPLDDMLADELDTKYDGVTLRDLLAEDETQRRETWDGYRFTPAQRAAISAHWSAELRARVQASSEQERCRVRVDDQSEP
jgi:hypothetical protein